MTKTRYIFIMVFILLTSSFLSCQDNNDQAIEIVDSYLRKQLSNNESEYFEARDYFHPNLAMLGGEFPRFHVVNSKYSIYKIRKEIMNIDFMEPKDEEITVVTVLFKRYCDIYNSEFRSTEEDYEREYFLSKSTGEILILDYSESMWETVSLGHAINWVEEVKEKSKKWSDLYDKLIYLKEPEDK